MLSKPGANNPAAKGAMGTTPKQWTILGVLMAVLAVAVGRMLIPHGDPASAGAQPLVAPPQPDELSDVSAGDPQPGDVHHPDAPETLRQWSRQAIVPIGRNLFALPLDYYPRDVVHSADDDGSDNPQNQAGIPGQDKKSGSAMADQDEQRRNLEQNVRAASAALNLQSTLLGSQPSAIVNGEFVKVGSVVAGFSVLQIEARLIVVERQGVQLEIRMPD